MTTTQGYRQRIKEAIAHYDTERRRKALKKRLIAGYRANAAADLAITHEWQAIDKESWLKLVPAYEGEEPANDAADTAW